MSLINKMLKDLDARGGAGTRADASSLVRPVNHGARGGLSPLAIGGAGVLALAVLGGAGFAAWKYFGAGKQAVSQPVAARAAQPVQPAQPTVQANGPVAESTADEGPPVVPGNIPPEAHRAAGEQMAREMAERNAAARRVAAATVDAAGTGDAASAGKAAGARGTAPAQREVPQLASSVQAATENVGTVRLAPKKEHAALERAEEMRRITAGAKKAAKPQGKSPVSASVPVAAAMPENSEAGLNPQQKAENEYRRALLKLQDARVSEAIASLEQALLLYPRHEAARQTLVGLLVEGGRTSDAIRHLALATSLDPAQANMAMLLARLQLENGGNALETLQRSLPFAESNADYRALLAGVLQRGARHKEAIDQYQAAVRLQPGNGIWWMGMGISLQADKRNADAKLAFQRARDSGRLTPELETFVERRLQQLD